MVSVLNSPYSNSSLYSYTNGRITATPSLSEETKSASSQKANGKSGDTVTLSNGIAAAKTREAMGLNPTGPLKLGDFEKAAETQEEWIRTRLESAMKDAGISTDQDITLTLDSKSKIAIKENISNRSSLEKALNEDKEFLNTFKSLSANNEVLDYTNGIKTQISNTTLADFMNSDSDWSDIMAVASKYTELKVSDNPIQTILGICRDSNPYEYILLNVAN